MTGVLQHELCHYINTNKESKRHAGTLAPVDICPVEYPREKAVAFSIPFDNPRPFGMKENEL